MKKRGKKVIVAMSGGLDSSVAAALLKKAGFNVVGIFMKFWLAPEIDGLIGSWNRCCSSEAEARARKVAKILNIPFYVFNFEKEFKKRVVDYFLEGYKKGLTPNPCVVCNKEIKFGLLLERALELDAHFVATGHYAKIKRDKNGFHLLKAKDENKDQSYFLWMLNQEQLKKVLFPIGDYTRAEVGKLAKKFKLDFLLNIPKSMEICFIRTTINDFLKQYLTTKPGNIVDVEGNIFGRHQGLFLYTIGQRKRIGLPGGPYWVLGKDLARNVLIITKNEKDLYKKELITENINWLSGREPELPLKVRVKIRYRHQPALATITKNPERKSSVSYKAGLKIKSYKIIFNKSQRAITPGQSVVFYSPFQKGEGEELLGGGIIC